MRILTIHFAASRDATDQETDAASDVLDDVIDGGAIIDLIDEQLISAGLRAALVVIESDDAGIF